MTQRLGLLYRSYLKVFSNSPLPPHLEFALKVARTGKKNWARLIFLQPSHITWNWYLRWASVPWHMDCHCTPRLVPSPSAIPIMSRTTVTWPAITYFPGPFPIPMSHFGRNADIEPDTRADRLLEAADRMRGSRGEVAEGLVRSERIFDLRPSNWGSDLGRLLPSVL